MENKTEYLGDGVYAVYDGFGIQLRVNDMVYPSDVVYLEDSVINALNRFWERIKEEE